MIIDLEIQWLEEIVDLLDAQLDRIDGEIRDLTGLGFAACQNYIVSISARFQVTKGAALQSGPVHRSGEPLVRWVNAAANKHSSEWDGTCSAPRPKTAEAIAALNLKSTEYALTNILYELVRPLPVRLQTLLPFLVHWRDNLHLAKKSGMPPS